MSRGGVLGSVFNRLKSAVTGKEFVGKDAFGNCFYKKIEADVSGGQIERRLMEPPQGGPACTSYDPTAIAPQWRQWLSKTRLDPPTEQEMES